MNDIQKKNYYQKISNLFETMVEEVGVSVKDAFDTISTKYNIPFEDIKSATIRFRYSDAIHDTIPRPSRYKGDTKVHCATQKVTTKEVVDLYRSGLTMGACGRKLGITQQRVSQIIAKHSSRQEA